MGMYGERVGDITAFIGQSYRFHTDRDLRSSKLLEENFSDYVGRVDLKPNEYVDLLYGSDLANPISRVEAAVGFSVRPRCDKGERQLFC